jgi:glutamine cyclotransferase
LNSSYFGEGVTSLNGKVYQLTWQEDTVFVYDVPHGAWGDATLGFGHPHMVKGVLSQFAKREGWGLTNDGTHLIASDGSSNLYLLEAVGGLPLVETRQIRGLDPQGDSITEINELEYAHGLVFFNIWYKSWIGVYDWQLDKIVAWLDCRQLSLMEKEANPDADVMNGIAFVEVKTRPGLDGDPQAIAPARRLALTGKLWSHVYEVDFELPPVGYVAPSTPVAAPSAYPTRRA